MTRPQPQPLHVLAVDVCPRARQCQHRATSTIGPAGNCPDCGTQVYRRPAPLSSSGNHGAQLHTRYAYDGTVL